jgi:hypothetical protein
MSRARLLFALPLLATTAAPLAEEPRPEGRIDAGDGRSEILSRPLPVGRRIELPEGWFQVDEEGVEDRHVGSFTVAAAVTERSPAAAPARAAPPAEPAEAAPPPRAAPDPCLAQRTAYLRELWKTSGIEVDDPVALQEGLEAGTSGPAAGFYWYALATDPFRPLAWSTELQSRARALVRCVNENAR